MPTRSLIQPCLKHMDHRWNLLKWIEKNASEHYLNFDAIFRQYPQNLKWYDLINELAMLCHHRQVSFKESNRKTRYMFHSWKSEPIMPLVTQPQMTVDDYICAVQPSYTTSEILHEDDMTDLVLADISSDDDEAAQIANFGRYAHPFCIDSQPDGELIWLRFT